MLIIAKRQHTFLGDIHYRYYPDHVLKVTSIVVSTHVIIIIIIIQIIIIVIIIIIKSMFDI